ncbi:FXYD domain-containing ion transport regulator 11-like [Dunckerocampus dactyliophorus]|uniref:FXYD domain-containing ion transport regulator 11-like n=1 Tax=Dunckerocampus dactyliophorus TaxID=161453 RepID=UPI002404EE79|nr:FXYD domain-containing ion transport regulator 11-like [Dunckerocampus dactyliophorus]
MHIHNSLDTKQRGGAGASNSAESENRDLYLGRTPATSTHTSCTPILITSAVLKMGHLTLVAVIAVLFSIFTETEASAFVYNYDRLRIVGLVCSGLLFIGGLGVLLYNKCTRRPKKEDDSSEI